MAVGPIEAIRAQEATQIRHMDTQRAQHAQEQFSRNFQNMVQQEQSKPTETVKADQKEYRYDAKEKGNNQYYGSGSKKRGKQEEKNKPKASKSTSGSGGFDIKI